MPFYEYECQACKYYTEVMQKISDKPLVKCPSCGKRALKKLVSAPVFRLKGAGWYETDFKTDKENKRNLSGPDKDEAKADTKAEAKDDKAGKDAKDAKEPAKEAAKETAKETAKESKDAKPAQPKAAAAPERSSSSSSKTRRRAARPSSKMPRKRRR
jgi:putative FmdB family regulatory protein